VKKVVWLFTAILILFIAASCGGRQYSSKNIILHEHDESTEELVIENQYLNLRFDPATTEVVLTDKAKGTQWYPLPKGEDPLADPVTRNGMNSLFFLEYTDVYGIGQTLFSGEHSVDINTYSYSLSNNVLEVDYSVGRMERTYVIPPVITEDRMKEFTAEMSQTEKSLINAGYRLYNINALRRDDNKDELLATYPDLARRNLYVLATTVQEYQKAEYESYFSAVGYTYEDYLEDIANFPAISGRERPAFNITLRYSLDGRALVLDIPFDKIAYRIKYPITTLSVFPYMGASGFEDEGYLFVPDGSGALIRFNNNKQSQQPFSTTVYGWDEGRVRKAIISDNRAPFAAYGIQKNNNALLCIIENGSSYSSVRADVSGRNNSYNNVYARFTMVHSELMNISGRSQRDVYQYERSLPDDESITLRFIVCDDDGYVGMAKEYRKWLQQKYPSIKKRTDANVPIVVEIPGAVNKTQHRLGIPFDLPLKLTSYKETADMINNFSNLGWKNVKVKLNGWFNRSVDHTIPTRIRLINTLGSKNDFKNIISSADQHGYQVYPEVDFFFMRDKKPFDGFNLYHDASRYINRERIQRYPYSFVWFGERNRWGKLSYVARPETMASMIDNFVVKTDDLGIKNIAFRNIGSRLAGNYNERNHVSREGSMNMRKETLTKLNNSGTGVMLLAGHAYAAPWADVIVDMALECQDFGITDVSVPFYQIALHGLIPYTGKAINLAEDYTDNILKSIESGAGLYFSFMTKDTDVLQETKFRQFYANVYHKWIGDADKLYKQFSADFGHLSNQAIDNHQIISHGVSVTTYEDGTNVVVNNNKAPFNYNGREIGANNYIVEKRGN